MKPICTFILLLISFMSFGNPIIQAEKDGGKWSNQSDWNLNREPRNSDLIIIPTGITFTVDENNNLDGIVVIVYGTLKFSNGKLRLDDLSRVIVEVGGRITGNGNNDQIAIGNTFVYRGKDPDVTGYSYADNSTGSGFIYLNLLPVTFTSFTVNKSGNNIQLTWTTSKEINNSHFEIERSTNGRTWNKIGTIMGADNSDLQHTYNYIDRNVLSSSFYYRIRQVDFDGRSSYSVVKAVINNQSSQLLSIYSSNKTVNIAFSEATQHAITLRILDINGRLVGRKIFPSNSNTISLTVENATAGIFIVQASDNTGWSEVKKILVIE